MTENWNATLGKLTTTNFPAIGGDRYPWQSIALPDEPWPAEHDTPGCSLRYHGCINLGVTLIEDSYAADVHDNPGHFIWACVYCRSELALNI